MNPEIRENIRFIIECVVVAITLMTFFGIKSYRDVVAIVKKKREKHANLIQEEDYSEVINVEKFNERIAITPRKERRRIVFFEQIIPSIFCFATTIYSGIYFFKYGKTVTFNSSAGSWFLISLFYLLVYFLYMIFYSIRSMIIFSRLCKDKIYSKVHCVKQIFGSVFTVIFCIIMIGAVLFPIVSPTFEYRYISQDGAIIYNASRNGDLTADIDDFDLEEMIIPSFYLGQKIVAIKGGGSENVKFITLSNSITSIDNIAFINCSNLAGIKIDSNNKIYESMGDCIIQTDTQKLILGCKKSIIPADDSVIIIDSYAFCGCNGMISITIPNNITQINTQAFYNCTDLVNINYLGTMDQWNKILKDNNWAIYSGLHTITCIDGTISI